MKSIANRINGAGVAKSLLLALLVLLSVSVSPWSAAPAQAAKSEQSAKQASPPGYIAANAPDQKLVGQGLFRWFGFRVYEARLWTTNGRISVSDPVSQPLALSLTYSRSLDGLKIAEQSTKEISALGRGDEASRARWDASMKSIFPDVAEGDTITGLASIARTTKFFLNGKPIGEVTDPLFTSAFFSIWLNPKTSAPRLREELLAGAETLK